MHRRENPARILIITGIALKSDDLEREESAFPGTPVYRYHRNLLSETGLRVSEGLSLYVEDLDLSLDNEHLTVIGKGDKRRTVLLDDPRLVYQFRAYLKQMGYKHGGRWSERKRTGNDNAPLESSNQVRYIFNSSSNRNTSSPRYPMTPRIDYTDIDYTATLDAHIALLQSCRAYEYYKWQHYEEALAIYEQALQLNPLDASSYNGKGDVLRKLR